MDDVGAYAVEEVLAVADHQQDALELQAEGEREEVRSYRSKC